MGPQRRMGIYVGYDSPSIIKYLEPTTGDLFKARYEDSQFDESTYPSLGGDNSRLISKDLEWFRPSTSWQDPRTRDCDLEVQKIIHLQELANKLPEAFTDPNRMTLSHNPACNAPIRLNVQEGQCQVATESKQRLKRGRPIGSKDKQPRKSKRGAGSENIKETVQDIDGPVEPTRTDRSSRPGRSSHAYRPHPMIRPFLKVRSGTLGFTGQKSRTIKRSL